MDFHEFAMVVRDQKTALARQRRRAALVEVPRSFDKAIVESSGLAWKDEAGDPPRTPLTLEGGRITGTRIVLTDGDEVRVVPAENWPP